MSKDVGLVALLHDPQGAMAPFLPQTLPILGDLYAFVVIVATPVTARETVNLLAPAGIEIHLEGTKNIGTNRRQALHAGLRHPTPYLHYCDFDRLVHWALNYPDELAHVVERVIPVSDYVALGRTQPAFDSHPLVQRELESLTNHVCSHHLGTEMDVTAGSCGLSRPVAHYLLQHSTEPSNATDTEWPILIQQHRTWQVSFVPTSGLEFETPTFFGEQISAQAHNPDNWAKRTQLARDSINAVLRLAQPPGAFKAPGG